MGDKAALTFVCDRCAERLPGDVTIEHVCGATERADAIPEGVPAHTEAERAPEGDSILQCPDCLVACVSDPLGVRCPSCGKRPADIVNPQGAGIGAERAPEDESHEADRLRAAITVLYTSINDDTIGWPEHLGDVSAWCREAVGGELLTAAHPGSRENTVTLAEIEPLRKTLHDVGAWLSSGNFAGWEMVVSEIEGTLTRFDAARADNG